MKLPRGWDGMRIGGDDMRLIDADTLPRHGQRKGIVYSRDIDTAPTIDAIPVETVCEMFGDEAPCNYGLFGVSVDYFMMSECGEWWDECDELYKNGYCHHGERKDDD